MVSRGLRRLLRVRVIEEEMSRQTLELAQAELHRLEQALATSGARERNGRRLVAASARSGELTDRLAGLAEERSGAQHARALAPWRAEAGGEAEARREEFLTRRAAMRQVETLMRDEAAREAAEADRSAQGNLDDWFGARLHREALEETSRGAEASLPGVLRPIWAEHEEPDERTLELAESSEVMPS